MTAPRCQYPGCDRSTQGSWRGRCPTHAKHRPDPALREVRWAIAEAMTAPPIGTIEAVALRWWFEYLGGADAFTRAA